MTQSAFPISGSQYRHTEGMTLRDYFAAKAMQPLIVSFTIQDINWTAEQAYKIADAMLKAREE